MLNGKDPYSLNNILADALVYPVEILVAWKGANALVLYFCMHCTEESAD